MIIQLEEYKFLDILKFPFFYLGTYSKCAYHGVIVEETNINISSDNSESLLLLEGELRPTVKINRSNVTKLPLKVLLAFYSILCISKIRVFDTSVEYTLREWRQLEGCKLDICLKNNFKNTIMMNIKKNLQKPITGMSNINITTHYYGLLNFASRNDMFCSNTIIKYIFSYFQYVYQMTINYSQKEVIKFHEKTSNKYDYILDLFPPMMFCKADTDKDRQYLCCANCDFRRGITSDHPFAVWLLKNSAALDRYYKSQFKKIINCLCNEGSNKIIQECNNIREQLIAFPEHHGVDIKIPQLSDADFWIPPEE